MSSRLRTSLLFLFACPRQFWVFSLVIVWLCRRKLCRSAHFRLNGVQHGLDHCAFQFWSCSGLFRYKCIVLKLQNVRTNTSGDLTSSQHFAGITTNSNNFSHSLTLLRCCKFDFSFVAGRQGFYKFWCLDGKTAVLWSCKGLSLSWQNCPMEQEWVLFRCFCFYLLRKFLYRIYFTFAKQCVSRETVYSLKREFVSKSDRQVI